MIKFYIIFRKGENRMRTFFVSKQSEKSKHFAAQQPSCSRCPADHDNVCVSSSDIAAMAMSVLLCAAFVCFVYGSIIMLSGIIMLGMITIRLITVKREKKNEEQPKPVRA